MGTDEAPPRREKLIGEMFQTIIDHIPVMLICYDGAANPFLVNREFTRVFGWTLEEARKVDLMAECYPDPACRKEARAYMAAAEPGWRDFRARARDGRTVETSWANVHLSDGSHIGIGIDVTERRRAEQVLLAEQISRVEQEKALEGRERYLELLENTSDWLWEVDRNGCYTYVGPGVRSLLGYEPDELLGKRPFDLMPPDEARRVEKLFASFLKDPAPLQRLENVNRHKDGRLLTLETSGVPFFGPDGALQGFRGVDRDVSDRVAAEDALRASEERYRSLFEGTSAAMLLIDPETGNIIDGNHAASRFYGYPRDLLRSRKITDLNVLPPAEVFTEMELARTGKKPLFLFTHRLASGELRAVEVSSGPIRIDEKDLLFSIIHDVTVRVRIEEALRESEERFRTLAEKVPQAVYETDGDGRIIYMNPHGVRLFGYSEGEIAGELSLIDLIDPAEKEDWRKTFRKRIEDGFEGPKEYLWVRKDGTKFPAVSYGAPTRREGRPAGTVGVLMDLSDRRKAETELLNAQKYEAVGRLAGGIAHHLNNLMTVVAGYGALIVDRMDVHDPWRREVEEMRRAGDRAARLTGQLLSYSRRQLLQPERIEPGRFLSEMEEEFRGLTGRPDVKVSILLDAGEWAVRVDREMLRNALLRLVDNSVHAMQGGGTVVIRSRKAEIAAERGLPVPSGKFALISVADTGVGMDAETRSHVFEPFFTTRQPGEGAGMSLPSVYGFVKQSKGYIFVESEPGKGTTVSIYLPLSEP